MIHRAQPLRALAGTGSYVRTDFLVLDRSDISTGEQNMTHPILNRIFMLYQVADERDREHQLRSTSAAAIVGVLIAFAMLEFTC